MKKVRMMEGFTERRDHWEYKGQVEMAFSVRDLSDVLGKASPLYSG